MAPDSPTGAGAGGSSFDISSINRNDLGVMIAGAVAFIASFFPYWGFSYKFAGRGASASISAWHSYATVGLLLLFAAAILIAVKTFAASSLPSNLPVGLHVAAAGLAGLGVLLLVLRAFTYPHASIPGGSYGVKWGAYVLFIAGIAEVVFAVLGMRESGEEIPGMNRGTAAPPAA
ncbi:MAG: hypothetical protein QOG53_1053 [Frankiales bacterium]|jgi:hypothetical protein|nr:hypothetical protein [Frankiales bacterium]